MALPGLVLLDASLEGIVFTLHLRVFESSSRARDYDSG